MSLDLPFCKSAIILLISEGLQLERKILDVHELGKKLVKSGIRGEL